MRTGVKRARRNIIGGIMKRCYQHAAVWILLLASIAGCLSDTPTISTFAFEHANVVDVLSGEVLPDQTVIIDGGQIAAVGSSVETGADSVAQVVDASGGFLIPGLWDMHIHLIDPDTPGSLDVVLPMLIANGVTGVRDLGSSSLDAILALREEVREGTRLGPRVVVAGKVLDGAPMVFPPDAIEVRTPEDGRRAVESLASQGVDMIKAYEMLQRDVFIAVVEAAKERRLRVAAHPPLSMDAGEVSDAGVTSFEHLRNIELACSSEADTLLAERIPLLTEAMAQAGAEIKAYGWSAGYGSGALVRGDIHAQQRPRALETLDDNRCAGLLRRLADNGTWQTPTLFLGQRRHRRADKMSSVRATLRYVPEKNRRAWEGAAEQVASASPEEQARVARHSQWYADLVRQMRDAGVGLLAGTDVSVTWMVPGFSLHEELQSLVRAGLTPLEALRAATLNPALYLDEADSLGTIESSRRADLVLLDANPLVDISNTTRIRGVMRNGRYLDRHELDVLLTSAEQAANPEGGREP
jgi:imidazolonepropionase-like amidohydrolase